MGLLHKLAVFGVSSGSLQGLLLHAATSTALYQLETGQSVASTICSGCCKSSSDGTLPQGSSGQAGLAQQGCAAQTQRQHSESMQQVTCRAAANVGRRTCGGADMYVVFLVQPDWGAANVTPGHQGGCIWARSEGWRVQNPVASDSARLLPLHACLGPCCLQCGSRCQHF